MIIRPFIWNNCNRFENIGALFKKSIFRRRDKELNISFDAFSFRYLFSKLFAAYEKTATTKSNFRSKGDLKVTH